MSDSGPSPAAGPSLPTEQSGPAEPDPSSTGSAAHPTAPVAHPTAPAPSPSAAAPASPAPPPAAAAPQLAPGRRAGLLLTLILGSLTALPALSMDMYLPALPEIGEALGSSAATVQLTLATCLLGLAAGQLVVGPMSDRWGRRGPLLIGMAGYVVASAACAFAPTVGTLTVFRLLQGLAGSAGIVIARAVVRDLYDGLAMARFFSTLMLVGGAAPVLAPVFGGQLLRFTDWRGIFLTLAVFGVVLTLVVARRLPETLVPGKRQGGGLGSALRTMGGLLTDRTFAGYVAAISFTFAALFAYVSASSFVVQEIYGGSPQTFSLLFMLNAAGMVATSQVNGRILVGRVSLDRVLGVGLCVVLTAAVALLLMTSGALGRVGLAPIAAGFFVLMSGMALILPNANTQALARAPHAAGSASALLGTAPFLIGAIAAPLVGVAGERTAVPMALTQVVGLLIAVACFLGLCRPWRRRRCG